MRRSLLSALLLFVLICSALNSKAQTTLALGDIAFTGMNIDAHPSDGGDHFSFVILRTGGITTGTTIRFTDRGWNTGACGTNGWAATAEGDILWTATSNLDYGAQVRVSTALTASTGTVSGTAFSFAATGDQIFAIQGTLTGAHTMIAGLHMNEEVGVTGPANWDNQSPPGTAAQSNKPTCLVNGTHALFINPEVDNARVRSDVVLSGDPNTDRSRINNAANWETSDITPFDLPGQLAGLPVNFTWIKASERGGRVQVEWGIGFEEEMKDYTVERSHDGRLYTEIGTMAAAGKSNYALTDDKPHGGANFYRIRATEINGIVKYSTVAIVNLSRIGTGITVYPSVIRTKKLSMQINNLPAGSYKLNLHNAAGQLVMSKTIVHAGGNSSQTIALPSAISNGVYRLNLTNGKDNAIATIVVN